MTVFPKKDLLTLTNLGILQQVESEQVSLPSLHPSFFSHRAPALLHRRLRVRVPGGAGALPQAAGQRRRQVQRVLLVEGLLREELQASPGKADYYN